MKSTVDEEKQLPQPVPELALPATELRVASPEDLQLRRRRCGKGFSYRDDKGRRITHKATLERIKALAIPPAYREVRIAGNARDHLQAVGRDEAGRLQYIYHEGWEEVREAQKVERLAELCRTLPRIRRKIARVLRTSEPGREKALAAVIMLIDRTHIRIGCDDYVHSGRSRGATTLLKKNVSIDGEAVYITFRGKRRIPVSCEIRVPAFTKTVSELLKIPGSRLFQYRDADGAVHAVRAADANSYLAEISGAHITAKDFRTLAATSAAADRLGPMAPSDNATQRRREIARVMKEVAEMLSNTPAVVRRSYVHRRVIEAFEADELRRIHARCTPQRELTKGEVMVTAIFSARFRNAEARSRR